MLGGKPVYLHMGHLIDKGGYLRFKERVLRDVQLNPEAMVAERITGQKMNPLPVFTFCPPGINSFRATTF